MLLCSTADIDSLAMACQLQFVSHKKIIASRLHCLYPGPHLEELSDGATGGFNRPHRCVERRGGTHFTGKERWDLRTDAAVPPCRWWLVFLPSPKKGFYGKVSRAGTAWQLLQLQAKLPMPALLEHQRVVPGEKEVT